MASPSSRDGSLPVPISLTVYNRLDPALGLSKQGQGLDETISGGQSNKKKWFRPDYTSNLLVSARLDIFLKNASDEKEEEKILYSSTIHQSSIHPVWDHLNERVPFDHDADDKDDCKWENQSGSIFARILLVSEDDPNGPGTILVKAMPLNPHSLRRLPKDDDEDSYSKPPAPSSLPPNAVLVHYSDGLVRVKPSLYHVLLQHHVIREIDPRNVSLLQDDDEEDKYRSRFDDTLFDILGKVDAAVDPGTNANVRSPSVSLKTNEQVLLSSPIQCLPKIDVNLDDDEDHKLNSQPIVTTQDEVDARELRLEHESLLVQIEESERLLHAEQVALQHEAEYLQWTVQSVLDLEEETARIRSATADVL